MTDDVERAKREMVRVRARDIRPVAWRLAVEFARPERSRAPMIALAVAMAPMFVLITLIPGTYHWSRRAVLVVVHLVPDRRVTGAVWVLVTVLAAVVVFPSDLPRTIAAIVVLIVAVVIAVGSIARVISARIGARLRPVASQLNPLPVAAPGARPRGQWLVIAAAATPGIDASVTCFEPLLRRIVPPGETVIVNAANSRLALLYREQGFSQAGAKPLSLSLTTPTAMQATGG